MSDKRMQGAVFILQAGTMNFRSRLRRDFGMGEEREADVSETLQVVCLRARSVRASVFESSKVMNNA